MFLDALGKDLFHHLAGLHSGEFEIEAGAAEGEVFVVDSEAVEDGGLEIGHFDFVFDDVEAHFVGGADGDPTFDAAARHPHAESLGVVIAAHAATEGQTGLDHGGAAKFAAPDHQGVIEHAALFEVFDQGGAGLIGDAAVFRDISGHIAVRVPTFIVNVDESHPAFHHAPGQEAGASEGRNLRVAPIHFQSGLVLAVQVHQLRRGALQAIGHFVVGDSGGGLTVAIQFEATMIHRIDQFDGIALRSGFDAFGRADV